MSDTPKCDAFEVTMVLPNHIKGAQYVVVSAEFARQLERDLAAAQKALEVQKCINEAESKDLAAAQGKARITDECYTSLRRELADCKAYLKEGETVTERLARYHKEVTDLMKYLATQKAEHEAAIKAAVAETARRCFQIAGARMIGPMERAQFETAHDIREAIRKEFPEAWK